MSASRAIQAASIFYLDSLLATASALYTSSCLLFWLHYIFLHRHFLQSLFSGFVVFNSFLKAVGEALHSLFYISFSEFAGTSTNSTISYLVSLCLVSVALFSCLQFQPIFYFIDIFSTYIFLDFSHCTPRWRQRGKSSTSSPTFHSSFAGMHTHRHSVLKGPWQLPFPVLAGLKVPVYKVKFVIRKFGLEVTATKKLLSSAPTTPCHTTSGEFLLSSLRFNFRGQDKIFLLATSTPLPCS